MLILQHQVPDQSIQL